jgi:alpha-beta hydrolase superfamily lysophospholipase
MRKIFIKNRKGQKISVLVEEIKDSKGLAFVMHGLGGYKEQPHIQTIADVFRENNYTVVRFDTTNTFGESEGNYEDATTTNYYEDLEDVINWAKSQKWYGEPFILAGHSLGGICTTLYTENYPNKVKALAPISTVVSGKLSKTKYKKEELEKWEKEGIIEKISYSGKIKRLKWNEMKDRMKYNLLDKTNVLKMPVLMIVGENDNSTPVEHQKILFDALSGKKEFHIIKNAEHTFRDEKHLEEIKRLFDKWIKHLE